MSTYTDELNAELERVTLRGNPDKKTIQKLSSIIWRLDQRLQVLEGEVVVDDKPAPIPEAKPVEKTERPKKTVVARKGSPAKNDEK